MKSASLSVTTSVVVVPEAVFNILPPLLKKGTNYVSTMANTAPTSALLPSGSAAEPLAASNWAKIANNGNSSVVQTHVHFTAEMRRKGFEPVHVAGPNGAYLPVALAFLLFGNTALHLQLRRAICDYMGQHPEVFSTLVGLPLVEFETYLVQMRKVSTWGTYVEIDAAAKMSGRTIEVFSDSNNNVDLAHINIGDYPQNTLFLANYGNRHFEPCVPVDLALFPGYLNFRQPFSAHFLFPAPFPPYPEEAVFIAAVRGSAIVATGEVPASTEHLSSPGKKRGQKHLPATSPEDTTALVTLVGEKQKRKRSREIIAAAPDTPPLQPGVGGRVQRKRIPTEKAMALKEEQEEKERSKKKEGKRAKTEEGEEKSE